MQPIRILLADDHAIVRAGIRALLEKLAGVEVVAEAGDGREALRLIKEHRPDAVLLDVAMPMLNGLDVAARATKEFPDMRVIILSMHTNEEYVWEALRSGASGYMVKTGVPAELELAIKAVTRGETYLSPPVSKHVVLDYVRRMGGEKNLAERLTPRQREILKLIAEGHTTKAIADLLSVSVKTVEAHRLQLMERLDIHDITGLVRYAIRTGLVTIE